MKARAVATVILMMVGAASARADTRIHDDRGGRIGEYLARYKALRASVERVIIDGVCASACTMILGAIPRDRICVTARAVFEFHTAWDPTPSGDHAVNQAGNKILWENYPSAVRKWISRHGGLRSEILYLRGPELAAMYPTCH
jgi:hypothetical protein